MKKLNDYYNKLLNLTFPDPSIDDDNLADFYADLVEVDGYYAGLIKSILRSGIKKNIKFDFLEKIRKKFDSIKKKSLSKNDQIRYEECEKYLIFLEILPSIINK